MSRRDLAEITASVYASVHAGSSCIERGSLGNQCNAGALDGKIVTVRPRNCLCAHNFIRLAAVEPRPYAIN
jgi:hypothetical protein